VVFAASSLADAFEECEVLFESANPGVDVLVSTAGSQALRTQIEHGAAADVFASANLAHVEALRALGLVEESVPLARNRLVVAVPVENTAGIRTFADLPDASRIVIGNERVPLGEYTRLALAQTSIPGFSESVMDRVVSEEPNARLVLAKVALGEADAAVVYRTDALGRDDVLVIELPDEASPLITYAIATATRSGVSEHATAWVEFVTSEEGCVDALHTHHFEAAGPGISQ
jgi:molybdate transport system substrate-binding protein